MDIDIAEHNRRAWNRESEGGKNIWTIGVGHDAVTEAKNGIIKIFLTPTKPVPTAWFPKLSGCKVLALASGGGQQAPLLAAAGAEVTLLDASDRQIETDLAVCAREGLKISAVRGDMRDLSCFSEESFDLIIHPVSNLFVDDVKRVWRESARVLKSGGLLLAGFANPIFFMFDAFEMEKGKLIPAHKIPYSPFNDDARSETERFLREGDTLEWGHSLEDQIGGQCDAGFAITGMYEDWDDPDDPMPINDYSPSYIVTKAIKL